MSFKITLFIGLFLLILPTSAQRFYTDDPIADDADNLSQDDPIKWERSDYYDAIRSAAGSILPQDRRPAENINTLGNVPNSTWYTNRHYTTRLSQSELRHGANQSFGPSLRNTWSISVVKNHQSTPVLTIRDDEGHAFTLCFDDIDYPEASTGAQMISNRLFYALGYHTPETFLVKIDRQKLRQALAVVVDQNEATAILDRLHTNNLGQIRAVATRRPAGQAVGPFLFYGTRPDDANDIIPHENRRELRGLKVFASWVDMNGISPRITSDYVNESGVITHYLTDFSASLGTDNGQPQAQFAGHETALAPAPVMASFFSLGFWVRPWVKENNNQIEFNPATWQATFPAPSFLLMDDADAFWAGRQVAHFTDDEINAIVSVAEFSDPTTANQIAQALKDRRDVIATTYLGLGGGLDQFKITDLSRFTFTNTADFSATDKAMSGTERTVSWHRYSNQSDALSAPIASKTSTATSFAVPFLQAEYLAVKISTPRAGKTVIYLRKTDFYYQIVGISRQQ